MSQPLIADLPYPEPEELTKDIRSLKIISHAYATPTGALNAALQIFYQSMIFSSMGQENKAKILKRIAAAKLIHLELLGKTIAALGAQPVFTADPPAFYNFYSAKFINFNTSPRNMLEDDVIFEKRMLFKYRKMLSRLYNEKVKAIIGRITEDDKLHLSVFGDMLKELSV